MSRPSLKHVGMIAIVSLFFVRPTLADEPSSFYKTFGYVCGAGLNPAADADRAEDASDNDTAIVDYQKAIMGYGQCLEKNGEDSPYAPDIHSERAHVRIMLTDLLFKANRTDDAQNQLFRILGDMVGACSKFDMLATNNKNRMTGLDAPIYATYATKYGAPNPDYVRENCHPAY